MDYRIVKASFSDVDKVYSIMQAIAAEIGRSDTFYIDGLEYIKDHVEKDGLIYTAVFGDVCAGFIIIDIPGDKPHNLGIDLNIEAGRLLHLAHMDSMAVLQEHRGFGLQQALLSYSEKELMALGYTEFVATVHPDNKASLKSFIRQGYEIKATKSKYGGYLRHILHKSSGFDCMK